MTCLQRQRKAAGQFRIFLLDALPAAEFGDCHLGPSRKMRIFSSAEYCLRVDRRMSRTSRSDGDWLDGVSGELDLCLMST